MFELAIALLSVLMIAVSQLLFKAAMLQTGTESSQRFIQRAISQPKIIFGLVLNGGAALCWIWALRKIEISFVYPLLSINYLLVPLGAWWLFGEGISRHRLAAIGLICIGVFVCLLSGTP